MEGELLKVALWQSHMPHDVLSSFTAFAGPHSHSSNNNNNSKMYTELGSGSDLLFLNCHSSGGVSMSKRTQVPHDTPINGTSKETFSRAYVT